MESKSREQSLREQFQEWWEEWFGDAPLTPWDELWHGDGYTAESIDIMWDAWQASREAIEISVPVNDFGDTSSPPGEGWSFSEALEVLEDIRCAGINVKGK